MIKWLKGRRKSSLEEPNVAGRLNAMYNEQQKQQQAASASGGLGVSSSLLSMIIFHLVVMFRLAGKVFLNGNFVM